MQPETDCFVADQILECLAVGIFTVDKEFRITFFNAEAERLTGFKRQQALGKFCYEIFRSDVCLKGCAMHAAMQSCESVVRKRVTILDKHNREIPVEVTASVLRDADGQVIGSVESFVDDSARVQLEKEVLKSYNFADIKGRSEPMRRVFHALTPLAESQATILILGETGTGKDLVARAVHNTSPRREGPFVKVNCPALPENLLESELFGYKRGAFTDARGDKPGRFELAKGGSIFLDEIGDLPLSQQAKLLQVLEEQEFYALGATAPTRVDARCIASTNRDLETMVETGEFRRDLYYRLQVGVLHLPPLRERREDIPLLCEHFVQVGAATLGVLEPVFESETMRLLLAHDYPGNVRQLKNVIEHALLLQQQGRIQPHDLPQDFLQWGQSRRPSMAASEATASPETSGGRVRQDDLRERILAALEASHWNKQRAAQALGLSRTTLWRRMTELGLDAQGQSERTR